MKHFFAILTMVFLGAVGVKAQPTGSRTPVCDNILGREILIDGVGPELRIVLGDGTLLDHDLQDPAVYFPVTTSSGGAPCDVYVDTSGFEGGCPNEYPDCTFIALQLDEPALFQFGEEDKIPPTNG